MIHTTKQSERSADDTVIRLIPIETLTQAQLQVLAANLKQPISFERNSRGHLIARYDAAMVGFTQVLLQLRQMGIKVRDSR